MFRRNPERPFSAWLIERIPQTVRLRSGLRIHLRNHADAVVFWSVFSSREYLALVPDLADIRLEGGVVLDCGAGIGMFTLLTEHLHRVGLLDFGDYVVEAIEPAGYNVSHLQKNFRTNLEPGRYTIHQSVVGRREGVVAFHESPKRPWSGSLLDRDDTVSRPVERSFVDLEALVGDRPFLLKADIEGGEFDLIETYGSLLGRSEGVVLEWHDEMGDVARADRQLQAVGLRRVRRSLDEGRRMVDLYRPA